MRDRSDILFAQTSTSPPADVVGHLDTMFGGLTRHVLAPRDGLPVVVECTQCRNNQGDRRDAVCQTRGVAELANELGRDHAEVGAILDACLANGWMERSYRIVANGG
jgi:hypothetical protein